MKARRKYGQHFVQPAWADRLVDAIAPASTDRFLEIGPGPGALTLRLAARVERVLAVEVDPEMIAALRPRLPPNVELIQRDFLDLDILDVAGQSPGRGIRVAGNLPYNVSSPILIKLLKAHQAGAPLEDATLMLQREVADRIESGPGTKAFGTLSIFVQRRARVRRLLSLPPGAFRPSPKVHSSVLRLEFHPPEVAVLDEETLEALVRSIFTQRRKTLGNALKPFAESRHVDPRAALAAASLDGQRRPETLQLTELARLADVFPSRLA
jgi:16S rRNA (adenine1518-N6/adenine1519-N6)-dimethyltransferase